MTAWMDEDEGGKQSSAWVIISALAERGRLGYKEEEMVNYKLFFISLTNADTLDGRTRHASTGFAHHVENPKCCFRR
jgi:hypothetical protein